MNGGKGVKGKISFWMIGVAFCLNLMTGGVQSKEAETATLDDQQQLVWTLKTGMLQPESVIYDRRHDVFYVSNMGGGPLEKNQLGYISKVSSRGELIEAVWLGALDAPKGMAIVNERLYVSDIDRVVVINTETVSVVKQYPVPQAKSLNDVTADEQGNVYVSDVFDNTIYRIADNAISPWLQDEKLEFPNGLTVVAGHLIVAAWGVPTDGFTTKVPGHLKRVGLATGKIESLGSGTPLGNLDGVEPTASGDYLVTDWMKGVLFKVNDQGEAVKQLQLTQGMADMGYVKERQLVLLPMMLDNEVRAYQLH